MSHDAEAQREVTVDEYAILQAQQLPLILPMYRLTATEYDVWNTLLGHMQHGGTVPLGRGDIATRLNIDAGSVSRALKRLRDLGLIWQLSQRKYQVNPVIAFKGSPEEWVTAMDSLPEDVPPVPFPDHAVRPPRRTPRRQAPRLHPVSA